MQTLRLARHLASHLPKTGTVSTKRPMRFRQRARSHPVTHRNQRLRQNGAQEKLTAQWIDACLAELRLREGARCCQPDFERATWNGGRPGRLGWMAETGRGAPAGLCVLNSAAFPPSTRNLLVYPDVFRKSVRAYRTRAEGASYTIGEEFVLLGG